MRASGSLNTETASSKLTSCFRLFDAAFRESHSKDSDMDISPAYGNGAEKADREWSHIRSYPARHTPLTAWEEISHGYVASEDGARHLSSNLKVEHWEASKGGTVVDASDTVRATPFGCSPYGDDR